jgi:polyisoprenoid-binding protein YceI
MMNCWLKYVSIAGLLFSLNTLQAQKVNFDHGEIEFYTESILSDIEAVSTSATVQLDVKTGNIDVVLNVKDFEFEYELMQEHFNDKYLESDTYPQVIFKGKISQNISNITEETEVDAFGELTIHGVTTEIKVQATVLKKDGFFIVKSKIPVVFKDYNVDEPSILTKSVAKDVEVKSILYLK